MITGILWRLHYRYPFDYYLLRLAVIVIVMSISVRYLLQFNIGAAIAGGGICFTSLLFILKVFDEEDLMYMKSLLRRPTEDA
jgi:hypothetical protein